MEEKEISIFTVAKSIAWSFLERWGVQAVQFIIVIVLARILTPTDYGVVALLSIFINIAYVFVQSGLSSALIQKKDTKETDFSSVTVYCISLAIIIYCLLFLFAPTIANFYKMPELIPLFRVMALSLFPGVLNSIQLAILTKNLSFKIQFYAHIITAVLSGCLGIYFAINNYGAWALVFQQLGYQVFLCILLWFLVPWKPKLLFSYKRTKSLLNFGSKLLGITLIDTIYYNLENLILGKKYSAEILAFYDKGKMFPSFFIRNTDTSIQDVMFPVYSKYQDNLMIIKQMLRRTMSTTTFIVFPVIIGLACVAKPIIILSLGEKWAPVVPYLQIYCLISMCLPLQTTNLQVINAIGRSDVSFKLTVLKRLIGVLFLILAFILFNTPFSILWACFVTEIIAILINIFPNIKLLNYNPFEMFRDLFNNLFLALFMGICTYSILFISLPEYICLPLQCLVGVLCYILFAWFFKNPNFTYFIEKIKLIKQKN